MSFLIIIIQIILLDVIIVWGIKKTFLQFSSRYRKSIRNAFIITAAVSAMIVLIGYILQHQVRDYRLFARCYYLFGLVFIIYLSKSFYALSLIADYVISRPVRFLKPDRSRKSDLSHNPRHIVAKAGFWISLSFVCLMIWGILFGRYNFTVDRVDIVIDDLPPALQGYQIVQISDIHAGSFSGHAQRFQKTVDLINLQKPNLIVFTGDMVNNFAEEAAPLIPIFSQMVARDGKYAVLGNHDYGGYYKWKTPADSAANHKTLENAIGQMGFVLLNNQSVIIDPAFALIGMENWGIQKRHPKRGDLEKAMEAVRDIPFKLLLSHNPLVWREYVVRKTDIALTLSGHTHGMQIGVRLGGKRFSPALLFRRHYPYGLGLYRIGNQYLYVNRGLGVIGFPGRVGMSPEITVVTLRKGK